MEHVRYLPLYYVYSLYFEKGKYTTYINSYSIITVYFRTTLRDALIVALSGTATLHFGTAFGVFAFVWKLLSHGLRELRGIDDRWNNFIGGIYIYMYMYILFYSLTI
jgi:hypothetical protein